MLNEREYLDNVDRLAVGESICCDRRGRTRSEGRPSQLRSPAALPPADSICRHICGL